VGKGKGIACYTTKKFHHVKNIQLLQYQVALLTSENLDVIGIYHSQIAKFSCVVGRIEATDKP